MKKAKMNKMLKISLCILLAIALLGTIVFAVGFAIHKYLHRYDFDNFIGLTADQITKKYGEFDRCGFWPSTGEYRTGVYVIKPERVGFLGTYVEEYLVIYFDENGVAYECVRQLGGQGG